MRQAFISDCAGYIAIPNTEVPGDGHSCDVLRLSDWTLFLTTRYVDGRHHPGDVPCHRYIVTAWSNKTVVGPRGGEAFAFSVRLLDKWTGHFEDIRFSRLVKLAPHSKPKEARP